MPLNIRWLKHDYKRDFALNKLPPEHMPIVFGLVQIVTLKKKDKDEYARLTNNFKDSDLCYICKQRINKDAVLNKHLNGLKCLNCDVICHTICLANIFKLDEKECGNGMPTGSQQRKELDHLLPVGGKCPKCEAQLMWGDLIKYRLSFYKSSSIGVNVEASDLAVVDEDADDEEFVERDEDSD